MNVDEKLREFAPPEEAIRLHSRRLRSQVLQAAMDDTAIAQSVTVMSVRTRRRRRLIVRTVVAAAALGIVATGLSVSFDGGSPASAQERFIEAAPAPAYDTYGAFSTGSTVYIGNHQVTFDEKIKALYYTSEGVLVRMGKVAYTDTSGPSHYTLIRPDGTYTSIELRMGDRVVGTDPDSPNVAYAEPTGSRWSFVVIDLVTGKEVARTTVDGNFTWGGWEAPPVTLAGDRMWALFDAGWMEYNWRTGATRRVPGTKNAPLETAHGRFAYYNDVSQPDWLVKDFVTGELVRRIPMDQENYGGALSPDGRYVRLNGEWPVYDEDDKLVSPPGPSSFVSLATGKVVALEGRELYGWTPGGNTLTVDAKRDRLTVCNPATGDCDRIDLKVSSGRVKLGGLPYES